MARLKVGSIAASFVGVVLVAGGCGADASAPASTGGAGGQGATGSGGSGGSETVGNGTSSSSTTSVSTGSSSTSASGSGGSGGGVTHVVGACSGLAAPGTWENITPPSLDSSKWCTPQWNDACPGPGSVGPAGQIATYGAHSVALDPNNSGTVYLGTSQLGVWKTPDCGATWIKIDTGTSAAALDGGRNWTFVVDPTDSQVLYTVAGYGQPGVYKSLNGGVDWTQMLTPDITPSLQEGGFIEKISLDPTNHQHLAVSFHIACSNNPVGGGDWGCLAESSDGGASWALTNSAQGWTEGDGQTILAGKTWLFGNSTGGIWRTTDAGATWDHVYTGSASGSVLTGTDGKYYVAGGGGVLRSSDGITWTATPGSPGGNSVNGSSFIVDDGKKLYTSGGQYGGQEPATGWYASASDSDPTSWIPIFTSVPMQNGGSTLVYDQDHHLLYSSNLTAGLWRVVVP